MLRPHRAVLNPGASAGPLLLDQHPAPLPRSGFVLRLLHDSDKSKLPDGTPRWPGINLSGTLNAVWPEIEEGQRQGYGAFLVVNAGGHTGSAITTVRAVFIDLDNRRLPDAWHAEPDFLTVRDEWHAHAYWGVAGLDVEAFTEAQHRLAKRYQSDPTVCDLARVLRLAGTLHLKNPDSPRLVKLMQVRETWEGTRTAPELLAGLPEAPKVKVGKLAAPDGVVSDAPHMIARAVSYLKGCGNDSSFQAACMLRDLAIAPTKALELMEAHHPFPPTAGYGEKIDHAYGGYAENAFGCKYDKPAAEAFGATEAFREAQRESAEARVSLTEFLSAETWAKRNIPHADKLLGNLVTTTTRTFFPGPTGLGKTMLLHAMGAGMASGTGFLHWKSARPAKVLIIDGEMPAELIKTRVEDALRRVGVPVPPGNLLIYGRDLEEQVARQFPSLPAFAPLNTEAGHTFVYALIDALGGRDVVIFDNVMSLLVGDQKDEVTWSGTLPLVSGLTSRRIGQVWADHTGHNSSRQYGSSTKGWRFDTVGNLTPLADEAPEPGKLAMSLSFDYPGKARRRTPDNWRDFEACTIRLTGDQWSRGAAEASGKAKAAQEGRAECLAIGRSLAEADAYGVENSLSTRELAEHRVGPQGARSGDDWRTAVLDEVKHLDEGSYSRRGKTPHFAGYFETVAWPLADASAKLKKRWFLPAKENDEAE